MPILEELISLEKFIHWPTFGTLKPEIENLLDADFWEVGASGKKYNREIVLKVLLERSQMQNLDMWTDSNFYCKELAKNTFLLTYTIIQGDRKTERASIWKKYPDGYKIIYHQGTICN